MKSRSRMFILGLLIFISNISSATLIHVPQNLDRNKAKVIVVIHGCLQSPESMAIGSEWGLIAEKNNLVLVYPRVPEGSNPISCWNWYRPENQRRDSGQLKLIMDEVRALKNNLKLKEAPVFVVGISSGAATASGLLACFPQDFKAGAIHSGPSYGLASHLAEAERVLKEGPPQSTPRLPCQTSDYSGSVLVIHGSADSVVNPKHALRVIADFIGNTNSISKKDLKEGGLDYTVTDYSSEKAAKGRLVLIQGLGHEWPGFNPKLTTKIPFFTDKGPSSTQIMWSFFSEVAP